MRPQTNFTNSPTSRLGGSSSGPSHRGRGRGTTLARTSACLMSLPARSSSCQQVMLTINGAPGDRRVWATASYHFHRLYRVGRHGPRTLHLWSVVSRHRRRFGRTCGRHGDDEPPMSTWSMSSSAVVCLTCARPPGACQRGVRLFRPKRIRPQ